MTETTVAAASSRFTGRKVLEVIVTSVSEALDAEAGGADRLEVVCSLQQGGLTPPLPILREIVKAVRIPVRAMLRPVNSMQLTGLSEASQLAADAQAFADAGVSGFVVGYVRNGDLDERIFAELLAPVAHVRVTFHRAFEHLQSPESALVAMRQFPQIDRILVRISAPSSPGVSLSQVKKWQAAAGSELRFLVGVGLDLALLEQVKLDSVLAEVHIGRGAREPETPDGLVSQPKVLRLRKLLS